jgi:hypothetical protein
MASLAAAALVAGCTAPVAAPTSVATTAPSLHPRQVVRSLVEALGGEDWEGTRDLVLDEHLALLSAAEGGEVSEAARMVRRGVPATVREAFWTSFVEGLGAFAGAEIGEARIGRGEAFRVGQTRFVAVPLRFESGARHEWLLRRSGGEWKVDLIATFAGRFATPLRSWLSSVESAPDYAMVHRALQRQRLSLQAAAARAGDGAEQTEGADAVRRLLGYLGRS